MAEETSTRRARSGCQRQSTDFALQSVDKLGGADDPDTTGRQTQSDCYQTLCQCRRCELAHGLLTFPLANVTQKCRTLNNFSTLTSIISALGTAPIHRLNRTWSAVNQRSMGVLESMRKLMGSTRNFAEYRDTLHRANPPCIPFFG